MHQTYKATTRYGTALTRETTYKDAIEWFRSLDTCYMVLWIVGPLGELIPLLHRREAELH